MKRMQLAHRAFICVTALMFCSASSAWAQQKQKVSYKVTAENSKYTQRHTIDVGDEPGHTMTLYEIYRSFPANAPVINGVKLKETWTRGHNDYVDNNGLSTNYGIYVLENGDKFYTLGSTMGHADAAGKRTTVSISQITSGTGKLSKMKGLIRSTGVSDGKANINETQAEIEYWFAN